MNVIPFFFIFIMLKHSNLSDVILKLYYFQSAYPLISLSSYLAP